MPYHCPKLIKNFFAPSVQNLRLLMNCSFCHAQLKTIYDVKFNLNLNCQHCQIYYHQGINNTYLSNHLDMFCHLNDSYYCLQISPDIISLWYKNNLFYKWQEVLQTSHITNITPSNLPKIITSLIKLKAFS